MSSRIFNPKKRDGRSIKFIPTFPHFSGLEFSFVSSVDVFLDLQVEEIKEIILFYSDWFLFPSYEVFPYVFFLMRCSWFLNRARWYGSYYDT